MNACPVLSEVSAPFRTGQFRLFPQVGLSRTAWVFQDKNSGSVPVQTRQDRSPVSAGQTVPDSFRTVSGQLFRASTPTCPGQTPPYEVGGSGQDRSSTAMPTSGQVQATTHFEGKATESPRQPNERSEAGADPEHHHRATHRYAADTPRPASSAAAPPLRCAPSCLALDPRGHLIHARAAANGK
jgi:hypothetical protein